MQYEAVVGPGGKTGSMQDQRDPLLHLPILLLVGIAVHPRYPVGAVHRLLLLVRHGGAGDVQVVVRHDHGHRFTLVEAEFAKHLILGRNFSFTFSFNVTDSFARRSLGSGLVELLVPSSIVFWSVLRPQLVHSWYRTVAIVPWDISNGYILWIDIRIVFVLVLGRPRVNIILSFISRNILLLSFISRNILLFSFISMDNVILSVVTIETENSIIWRLGWSLAN